ncbi:MAG: ABC transporter substrate-binding protein [Nitrospirae bacterium]|nr:ABC transporter substrate-binding protein [Nitrospirota bacterium]
MFRFIIKRIPLIFVYLLILSTLGYPTEELESAKKKKYKVGIVYMGGKSFSQTVEGFKAGMRNLGYKDGKNVVYEVVNTSGSKEKIANAVKEVMEKKVNVIYAVTTPVTKEVQRYTDDKPIPVVFSVVADPVGSKFVKSIKEPGGNMTGISNLAIELTEKRLEMFKRIVPNLKKVMWIYDPNIDVSVKAAEHARNVCKKMGISYVEKRAGNQDELAKVISNIKNGEADGILHVVNALLVANNKLLIDKAKKEKVPYFTTDSEIVEEGALANYLTGVKPGTIPVEAPDKYDFIINLKTANAIDIKIPENVLSMATRVIK